MAKAKMLNVKQTLLWVQRTCEDMLDRNNKFKNGLILAPIDEDNLRQLKLITTAILKKHEEKKTRKDLYVEA